jgi:hypothetical protein
MKMTLVKLADNNPLLLILQVGHGSVLSIHSKTEMSYGEVISHTPRADAVETACYLKGPATVCIKPGPGTSSQKKKMIG